MHLVQNVHRRYHAARRNPYIFGWIVVIAITILVPMRSHAFLSSSGGLFDKHKRSHARSWKMQQISVKKHKCTEVHIGMKSRVDLSSKTNEDQEPISSWSCIASFPRREDPESSSHEKGLSLPNDVPKLCEITEEDQGAGNMLENLKSGTNRVVKNSLMKKEMKYDLSSPREWMEFIEADEGLPGAYTVLRCDLDVDIDTHRVNCDGKIAATIATHVDSMESEQKCNYPQHFIWGRDFHFKRIASSFEIMMQFGCDNDDEYKHDSQQENMKLAMTPSHTSVSQALEESRIITDALIQEAVNKLISSHRADRGSETKRMVKVLMITLLWQPELIDSALEDESGGIRVRGHAFTTNMATAPAQYNPIPITASIAVDKLTTTVSNNRADSTQIQEKKALPSRYDNVPLAKLSSWCRTRRPLEEAFKTKNIGEVILTRKTRKKDSNKDAMSSCSLEPEQGGKYFDLELLEGLTSNLFVVYKDGTLRTAGDYDNDTIDTDKSPAVLYGYARHLVLQAAERCGIETCHEPIRLQDAVDGLWAEAFVTSSVRLIIPVDKMVLLGQYINCKPCLDEDGSSSNIIWTETLLDDASWNTRKWRVLYDDILAHNTLYVNQSSPISLQNDR